MPDVFEFHHRVMPDEIDALGHANNVAYVQWMQDAALGHTAAQGWPGRRYDDLECGWVARSHSIEYRRPALVDEAIVIRTWVATMKKVTSIRRYRIHRAQDDALLAVAETKWAFVSTTTGQPAKIPAELATAFRVVDR